MFAVFLLIGLTNDRLSSDVATAFPAGSVVQTADARGASANSAYTPPQYRPKPSSNHRVTGIVNVALPSPASVGRIPASLEMGGAGRSPRTYRLSVSRPGFWNARRSPIAPRARSSMMSPIAPTSAGAPRLNDNAKGVVILEWRRHLRERHRRQDLAAEHPCSQRGRSSVVEYSAPAAYGTLMWMYPALTRPFGDGE